MAECETACLVEDPETKKRRPRDHLKNLEERLSLLERQIQPGASVSEPSATPGPLHDDQDAVILSQPTPATPPSPVDGQGGLHSFNDSPLDVTTLQQEPQYLGTSSAFAFAHLLDSSLRRPPEQEIAVATTSSTQNQSKLPPGFLPDHTLACTYRDAFFENIHPQYPFLHEPTFRKDEKMLFAINPELRINPVHAVPMFFANMVCRRIIIKRVNLLINSPFSIDLRHWCTSCSRSSVTGRGISFLFFRSCQSESLIITKRLYTSARSYCQVLSHNNLATIQALLAYAVYSQRSLKGPPLWCVGTKRYQCHSLPDAVQESRWASTTPMYRIRLPPPNQ